MPIYAYKCSSCGHADDVLQKISAAPLTNCPACGKATYSKQVTAPQFQLKGSGWYVTDFRGGNKPDADAKPDAKTDAKTDGAKADTKTDTKAEPAAAPATTPAANTPATTNATPAATKSPATSE